MVLTTDWHGCCPVGGYMLYWSMNLLHFRECIAVQCLKICPVIATWDFWFLCIAWYLKVWNPKLMTVGRMQRAEPLLYCSFTLKVWCF